MALHPGTSFSPAPCHVWATRWEQGRGTDGGQWQRPHVIQTAQAAAEADLRPVAGLARG